MLCFYFSFLLDLELSFNNQITNGKKTKPMASVLILMSMVLNMKVSGSTTYSMDKDERFGKLAAVTKELIWKDRSMVVGNTYGKTIVAMKCCTRLELKTSRGSDRSKKSNSKENQILRT